jgi:hypothetical protein
MCTGTQSPLVPLRTRNALANAMKNIKIETIPTTIPVKYRFEDGCPFPGFFPPPPLPSPLPRAGGKFPPPPPRLVCSTISSISFVEVALGIFFSGSSSFLLTLLRQLFR